MDESERVRSLNQQRELSGIPGGCSGACRCQNLSQHLLDRALLRCSSLPGRVPGRPSEFHGGPGEPGAAPVRHPRPAAEPLEDAVHQLLWRGGTVSTPATDLSRGEFRLRLQNPGDQVVLRRIMVVQRALGDACRCGHLIDASPLKALAII